MGPLKSVGNTAADLDDAVAKIPYIGRFMTTPMVGNTTSEQARQQLHQASEAHGTLQKIGYGLGQVGQFFIPGEAEAAGAAKLAELLPATRATTPLVKIATSALSAGAVNKAQGGSFTSGAVAGGAGGALGEAAPAILRELQTGAVDKINRTVGALKSDFNRGANPGLGYFQAGFGPSSSMGSIASKAESALEGTGEAIGAAVDSGTGQGKLIPLQTGWDAVADPILSARQVLKGPGGASTEPLDELSSTFDPLLSDGADQGGFTPRQYFDAKRNVARNTSWSSDPGQVGLKQVRQQIAGGMAGALGDALPELKPISSKYQNLSRLYTRAADRASTGRPALSKVGSNVANTALTAIGAATHGLPGAAVGAIPRILDSVPLQTGMASGMYYGGEALKPLVPIATRGPAAVLPVARSLGTKDRDK